MEESDSKPKCSEMRKAWFEHVRKVRVKMSRGQKGKVSHRAAMTQASLTWADEKAKLLRKQKREARKRAK